MNRYAYWFCVFTVVAALLLVGAVSPALNSSPSNLSARFLPLTILAAGVLLGLFRTKVTEAAGPLALSFVSLLAGILLLSHAETLVVTTLVSLAAYFRSRYGKGLTGRWKWLEKGFRAAAVSLAAGVASILSRQTTFGGHSLDLPTRLMIATFAFTLAYQALAAAAERLREGHWDKKGWREMFRLLPYYLVGAIVASSLAVMKESFGWQALVPLIPLGLLIYHHLRLHLSRVEDESRHASEIDGLHMRTIEALALAIEAKDHNSHEQLDQVQLVATALGEELGITASEMEALRAASLLHDIGKLAVPEHIISKPGKLSREEFEKLKTHPLVGAQILERIKFPYPVVPIVRHHHEKFNGGGYPDGLSGLEIPVGARILAVADAFVSMISDRAHRAGMTPDQAMARVSLESGICFDPVVVEALKKSYLHLDRIAKERQSNRFRLTTDFPQPPPPGPVPAASDENKPAEKKPADGFLASIAAARQEAQILFELAQELGNSLSLDETLSVFAIHLQRTIPFDTVAIFVRRESILRPEYVSGENLRSFSALEIPIGHGVSGWAAENRKPVLNGNPLMEPGYEEDLTRMRPMRSALALPLEGGSGVVGVLSLYNSQKDAFNRDHLRVLQAISTKVAMSIENALKYRQAENSASTDYLTGLLNARSLFLHLDSELARCRRLETPLAILVSDLDGFKGVNDRFGHLEGNKLLQRVATRLRESCREYDCVARMGGDEFVIVLPGLSKDAVRSLMPRLRETVREAGREVLKEDVIGFSVGEAYFPADGTDAEQILAEADKRMYQFKSRNKILREQQRGYAFDNTPLS